jgi:8-oxo-dGTP diphosphatase
VSVDRSSVWLYLGARMKQSPKFCARCGHALEELHLDGRPRMRCARCGVVAYQNPVPATAVVVQDEDGSLLLVKRASEPCPGRWCLPGGFIEADEPAEVAAARELEEETGLLGRPLELINVEYHLSQVHGPLLIVGYRFEVHGGTLQAGDDAVDARYFPAGQLPAVAFSAHRRLIQRACPEMLRTPPDRVEAPLRG